MRVILQVGCIRYPMTGIGRYVHELATGLYGHRDLFDNLYFFDGNNVSSSYNTRCGHFARDGKIISLIKGQLKKRPLLMQLACGLKGVSEHYRLSRYDGYIVHSPNFYMPSRSGVNVVTIHDLGIYACPECIEKGSRKLLERHINDAVNTASHILTPSESVKRELINNFNCSEDFVTATPLGCSCTQGFECDKRQEMLALSGMGLLRKKYTLYVGTIEPRKNVDFLLSAYETIPLSFRRKNPLVICGAKGWLCNSTMGRIFNAMSNGWVRYFNYVDESVLALLYRNASVFCFPSSYEGFGLPILEAMSYGVPVVCSNIEVFKEVAGDSAVTLSLDSYDEWGSAILSLYNEGALNYIQRGYKNLSRFSWELCCEKTIRVYKKLD